MMIQQDLRVSDTFPGYSLVEQECPSRTSVSYLSWVESAQALPQLLPAQMLAGSWQPKVRHAGNELQRPLSSDFSSVCVVSAIPSIMEAGGDQGLLDNVASLKGECNR